MRSVVRVSGVAFAVLVGSACGGGSHHPAHGPGSAARRENSAARAVERHPAGGVAYIVGASTDPYGESRPTGFGVASGLTGGRLRSVQASGRLGPSEVTWVGMGRLVVSQSVGMNRPPATLYAFGRGQLVSLGAAALRAGEANFGWSPNRKLIATQPWTRVSCGPGVSRAVARAGCTAPGRTIVVERADGTGRHRVGAGLLSGWTPAERLVLFTGNNAEFSAGRYATLDLRSGRQRTVLSSAAVGAYTHARNVGLGALAFSADGRYLAALALLSGFPGAAKLPLGAERVIVIARADGSVVRVIRSTDIISMFAWSPHGDQLAYTTSGFPVPHELYVLTHPRARPRRILSQSDHFDWVSWSPDDRWLLIDNEHQHAWELLRLSGHRQARIFAGAAVPTRRLARLGGQPLWCCPQDHYGGS